MKTAASSRLLAAMAGAALMTACSHPEAAKAQSDGAQGHAMGSTMGKAAPDTGGEEKARVPVKVVTSTSARSGLVEVTLDIQPSAHAMRAVGRVVIPDGVTLVRGERQVELGEVQAGSTQQMKLTLQVPAHGTFTLYSGVDLYVASGVLMHKESTPITLGE